LKLKEQNNQGTNQVLIGLGSNINPDQNISEALRLLGSQVSIRNVSSIYQSPSVGSSGPDYLNSAVLIDTDSSLDMLRKNILKPIENQLKRVRSSDKYMDRPIDLDVLIFNQTVTDPELWTQVHVAVPASDVLPEFSNPKTGEKISQAAKRLLPGINIQIRSDLSR
jgi:2-amino-4-hydroxy-6-hydroxymethyldihydropteridine diphosphokinase